MRLFFPTFSCFAYFASIRKVHIKEPTERADGHYTMQYLAILLLSVVALCATTPIALADDMIKLRCTLMEECSNMFGHRACESSDAVQYITLNVEDNTIIMKYQNSGVETGPHPATISSDSIISRFDETHPGSGSNTYSHALTIDRVTGKFTDFVEARLAGRNAKIDFYQHHKGSCIKADQKDRRF
jgi:hypothetical protein